jgi:hypothetical protein
MVYYKLHTTFISSNVTWSSHDVTGKLLILVLNNNYGPWELAENYNTDTVLCIIEYATEIKQATKLQENFLTFAVNPLQIQNPTYYQTLN